MSNIKEQLFAKIETLNTISRFIEGAKKDSTFSVEDIQNYLQGMKKSYKEAFETLERLPRN